MSGSGAGARKLYNNPPITEALCDFQFEYNDSWDWTIPGMLYEKIKETFPQKREQYSIGVELNNAPTETSQKVSQSVSRLQFISADKRFIVQVGPQSLTVNHLKPYSRWEDFQAVSRKVLEAYWDIARIKTISRIGLRYINQISIPSDEVEIADYFKLVVQAPPSIPQVVSNYVIRQQIPFEEIGAVLLLTLASKQSVGPKVSDFVLDIDFTTPPKASFELKAGIDWLDAAKRAENLVFEACLTDKAKGLFGGQKVA